VAPKLGRFVGRFLAVLVLFGLVWVGLVGLGFFVCFGLVLFGLVGSVALEMRRHYWGLVKRV